MFGRAVPLICAALAAGVTACSGSSSGHTGTTVDTPGDALAALAAKGAAATYTATYTFHQVSPNTTATVQVWRAEPSLRVDVVVGSTTATLLRTAGGTYSCSITGTKRSCLQVAAAGATVPAPFDVAPANLFGADLRSLASDGSSYDVRSAPGLAAAPPLDGGAQCFDVSTRAATPAASPSASPSPTPSASAVPSGRYCFTPQGVLAAASYPSGNTISLASVQTATPSPDAFTPYASPSPLPT